MYSCLGNPMDRGAWWAMVQRSHRVGHEGGDLARTQEEDKSQRHKA